MSSIQVSEVLELLYMLRDYLDTENDGPLDVIDNVRDIVYSEIQKYEMIEWKV